ncbi:MAG: argininosuccinate synthase, partial [Alistipes sp.]|nr:argininosuccinate synthase [Alistipes sp.]
MKQSVLLGFSGGIDSCTSALRLMAEGYHVVALTIDTMGDEAMLHKARTKAEEIGAEWLMYDAREEFKREIIDYFCQEYAMGHTLSDAAVVTMPRLKRGSARLRVA